jgi:hypothetical protein
MARVREHQQSAAVRRVRRRRKARDFASSASPVLTSRCHLTVCAGDANRATSRVSRHRSGILRHQLVTLCRSHHASGLIRSGDVFRAQDRRIALVASAVAAAKRPAIQRRQRRKISQLIALKRFASTAQNATLDVARSCFVAAPSGRIRDVSASNSQGSQ